MVAYPPALSSLVFTQGLRIRKYNHQMFALSEASQREITRVRLILEYSIKQFVGGK